MKNLFFSLLVALCATATFAQTSLLATLSHEGNITSYYGTNALKEAVAAAANSDVVTLSSGQFNAVDIAKAITVRGAGMAADSVSQPTILTGDFTLRAPSDSTDAKLILEGLYHNHTMYYTNNIKNAQIIKCRFNNIHCAIETSGVSMSFIQCRVNYELKLSKNSFMTCINSYINHRTSYASSTSTSNFDMQNCILYGAHSDNNSLFTNCIFVVPNKSYAINSTCMAYNCLAVGSAYDYFRNMPNSTNQSISDYEMFKTFKGTLNDDADFVLTDEAAAKYLGTDGTQVGIYGGMMPYETTPNNPQITKFNVASKSTADGKLSVDIQVGVAE